MRSQQKKQILKENFASVPETIPEPAVTDVVETEVTNQLEIADALNYMKYNILSKENEAEFKKALIKTRNHRGNTVRDVNSNLKEHFPYLYTNPELVRLLTSNYIFQFIDKMEYHKNDYNLKRIRRNPNTISDLV